MYATPSHVSNYEVDVEPASYEVPVPSLPPIDYQQYAQSTVTDTPV